MPVEPDYTYEERVAIMIHDGGLGEREARQQAYKLCYHRTERTTRADGSVEFKHTLVAPTQPKAAAPQQPEQLELMSFEDFKSAARERFQYE